MSSLSALCWLRHDLRVRDNPALTMAVAAGLTAAVYILDETTPRPMGGASLWWLHHSLASLAKDLAERNIPLILRRGDPVQIIPQLMQETDATELHASITYDPVSSTRDAQLAKHVNFTLHQGSLLHDPAQLKTKTGGFYKVYTPFSRAIMAHDITSPLPLVRKQDQRPRLSVTSDDLQDWGLLPTKPDWAGGIRYFWKPGEANALKHLEKLNDKIVMQYDKGRDQPGRDLTSRLSPYLAFGEISPRQIWHAVQYHAETAGVGIDRNRETFLKEIVWRDFAYHTLFHQPHLIDTPLDPRFKKFPWLQSDQNLRAWQRGKTGYPIVDAGMRQLWQHGWMHNRVRMIVASFLVKHLLLPWQSGEQWFWDTLVDADIAANTFNWQWVAGSGNDASPYFRIFNPMLQGAKFDPDGDYVRHYVPELKELPKKYIHQPWLAPEQVLDDAGVVLGKTYPNPIVDHDAARARALAAFQKIKN